VGSLIVVHDACVLYPAPLRDLLLQLATAGLDLTIEQLQRTRTLMDRSGVDSLVEGFEPLISTIHRSVDEKDRHVVAAAIHSHARVIVTFNLAHFPAEALRVHEMEAQHPDDFLMHLERVRPGLLAETAQIARARLRNPPVTAADYLDTIERQRLPATAAMLRSAETPI
jgi:hypothetical protein